MTELRECRVAAIQADPVHLDLDATVTKAEDLIAEAAANGANLIVFPETFLSAYPSWVPDIYNDDAAEHGRYIGRPWFEYWDSFVQSGTSVPSNATARLGRAAAAAGATVVMGFNERSTPGDEQVQLYNAAMVIGPDGQIIGTRRKLTPVIHEQIYHGRGTADDVKVFPTEFGNLGIAQCFENFSPLYKHALASMGEQIHCGLWYSLESTGPLVEAAARLHAVESGTWVIVATQFNVDDPESEAESDAPKWRSLGGSMIVSPTGTFVAGPVYGEETILYADIDPSHRRLMKAAWDPIGREGRNDIYDFSIRPSTGTMLNTSPVAAPVANPGVETPDIAE